MPIKDASYWNEALANANRIRDEAKRSSNAREFIEGASGLNQRSFNRLRVDIEKAKEGGGEASDALIERTDKFIKRSTTALFIIDASRNLLKRATERFSNTPPPLSQANSNQNIRPSPLVRLPNAITATGRGAGFLLASTPGLGVILAGGDLMQVFDLGVRATAVGLLTFSMLADGFDGMAATWLRRAGTSNPRLRREGLREAIGPELDDLADSTVYGTAAGVVAGTALAAYGFSIFGLPGLALGVAGGLILDNAALFRLAIFSARNRHPELAPPAPPEDGISTFFGLATTGAAPVALSLMLAAPYIHATGIPDPVLFGGALLGLIGLRQLMLSNIPYPHAFRALIPLIRRNPAATAGIVSGITAAGVGLSIYQNDFWLAPSVLPAMFMGAYLMTGPAIALWRRQQAARAQEQRPQSPDNPALTTTSPDLYDDVDDARISVDTPWPSLWALSIQAPNHLPTTAAPGNNFWDWGVVPSNEGISFGASAVTGEPGSSYTFYPDEAPQAALLETSPPLFDFSKTMQRPAELVPIERIVLEDAHPAVHALPGRRG